MKTCHDHWIGGQSTPPATGCRLSTTDPTNGQPGPQIAAGSPTDVSVAVAAAAEAQGEWAARPAGERAEILASVARAMEQADAELIDVERVNTGKIDSQLRMEVDMSVAYFHYYAGVVRALHGRTIDLGSGAHAYTRLEPYGVVGVITPWNLPLNQTCRAVAPALAVGNTVVCKPSEITSLSTLCLAGLASEAGLPDGVFNVVTGTGEEVGSPLAQHTDVRRLAFTGSVATGRLLASIAAERLLPMTLELGGKSPIVVFADADLDKAAAAAASAVVMNAGQVCSATCRLVADAAIHDELVDRIVNRLESIEPGRDLGPIVTEVQYHKVLDHLSAARAGGLEPLIGGGPYEDEPGKSGWYIKPTVFARVPRDAAIAREEIFGPVLVTSVFTGDDEALEVANDTDYGLVASVWTGDSARGLRLAERIDAGQVSVNGGPLTIETPFGGFKHSGYGREKGLEALHDYAQVKSISLALR